MVKVHSLIDKIYQPINLKMAWDKVKSNKGAGGIDEETIKSFGAKRPLGIPTIKDRVCQQAVKNRLEPIFEKSFNDCSFGYRPNRSPHMAMKKIWKEIYENGKKQMGFILLMPVFGCIGNT